MNPIRLILPSAAALTLFSCANKSSEDSYNAYDTYGPADASNAPYQSVNPADQNQTYDTPAEYEVAGNTPAPSYDIPPAPSTPRAPSSPSSGGGVATTHTVVKGDTLGGIARKYGVTIASIKAANNMTSDVVVLGRTYKIPAR